MAENPPSLEEVNRSLLLSFGRNVIPVFAAVLGIAVLVVVAITTLVAWPFHREAPPALPEGVTPEYRVYDFDKREMYSLSLQAANKALMANLMQIGVGISMGILCIFVGSAMSWFGVTGSIALGAEGAKAKLNLQTTQVGVVLLLGGILLTGLSIFKSNNLGAGAIAASQAPPPSGIYAPAAPAGQASPLGVPPPMFRDRHDADAPLLAPPP
jgi:hypothetical protein